MMMLLCVDGGLACVPIAGWLAASGVGAAVLAWCRRCFKKSGRA